ncbi:MAG: 4Fe-4S dicluster domain-containing protein [Oscillospiraceae bacterium]|nr:4Fe-4S dicluster domain-containing protein [Oscillospiraceae bacterium]
MTIKHAVYLDEERCRGCTSCIRSCPTEAIRVRNGKAEILSDRCIDCGKCIAVCRCKAIRAKGDDMAVLQAFDYRVALPEPALYGQFPQPVDVDLILSALLEMGFDGVYEVARAAELLAARVSAHDGPTGTPRISAACPTVLRLIRMRFPRLLAQLETPLLPMELAAVLARREACEKTGLPPERVGVFAIVPCSAKRMAAHSPDTFTAPVLDGAFSIRDICRVLPQHMRGLLARGAPLPALRTAGGEGLRCATARTARGGERRLAADGVENVIHLLEALEDGRVPDVDLVALSACACGCQGGCFTVENPHAAYMRLEALADARGRAGEQAGGYDITPLLEHVRPLQSLPSFLLDEDFGAAMEKQRLIQELEGRLPGLHCGSCGAPSCHAFAEDVALGRAREEDCIFQVRAKMQDLSVSGGIDDYLPAPFRRRTVRRG